MKQPVLGCPLALVRAPKTSNWQLFKRVVCQVLPHLSTSINFDSGGLAPADGSSKTRRCDGVGNAAFRYQSSSDTKRLSSLNKGGDQNKGRDTTLAVNTDWKKSLSRTSLSGDLQTICRPHMAIDRKLRQPRFITICLSALHTNKCKEVKP